MGVFSTSLRPHLKLNASSLLSLLQDLQMAEMARQEFTAILTEIEFAWHSEGRRMASRATRLNQDSVECFVKMSPGAVERLKSDSSSSGSGSDAGEEVKQLSPSLSQSI